ncbi:MAG: hypothetical protein AVDCRST_MAG68-2765, partial [uncultured Gemmatimonadetes bacterium]
ESTSARACPAPPCRARRLRGWCVDHRRGSVAAGAQRGRLRVWIGWSGRSRYHDGRNRQHGHNGYRDHLSRWARRVWLRLGGL